MKKKYNFSNIKFSDLEEIVSIEGKLDYAKFDDWFAYDYQMSEEESLFLEKLRNKHILYLTSYLEEDLKAKFLIPILNQVDFMTDTRRDWYDGSLAGIVNKVEINGFTDYMIALGMKTPKKPYFFIQEFKPSIPDRNPEVQLLAELLVTIEKNKTNIMRGGYIIGQYWKFVILEKIDENQFVYFVSPSFDSLELDGLKKIYVILQAVKAKYCND